MRFVTAETTSRARNDYPRGVGTQVSLEPLRLHNDTIDTLLFSALNAPKLNYRGGEFDVDDGRRRHTTTRIVIRTIARTLQLETMTLQNMCF
jgi:hypothetical protein